MKLKFLVSMLVHCLLIAPVCAGSGVPIKYHDVSTNMSLSFDLENKVFSNGDVSDGLFVCAEGMGFDCVIGGPIFAIPRGFDANSKEWEFDGYKFYNRGEEELKIMGEVYRVYRIEVPEGDGWLWYLYSPQKGVVVIGSRSSVDMQKIYVLQNSCGIASGTKCKR